MIVRKPYAFLIKHFRLIHGLIFALLTYIFIKSIGISSFFSSYASKHYFTNTVTLVSDHIDILTLIIPILIIILTIIIYYLLSIKNKNRKFYLFIIIYYFILFIYFIYMMSVFNKLQSSVLNIETVRVLRDISLILVLPQIIFLFLMISRTLGFNLKQFEFKKDLEELQIDTSDYEEVEITLGRNNYKYIRFFRKTLRELKYFIEENKFFVTIILSILVLSISIFIYFNIKVTNVKYESNETIFANTMWYTIKDSFITSNNTIGKEIDNNKKYVIVKVSIDNKSNKKYDLSRELFRLNVNKKDILPKFNLQKEFIDLGNIYTPFTIDIGQTSLVNVIFEIDKKDEEKEYIFKINNLENLKVADKKYKEIIINPYNIDENIESKKYNFNDNITFDNDLFGNSNLIIKSYKIDNSFKDTYVYCLNKKCYDKVYSIKPLNNKKSVIKLDYELNIDKNSYINSIIKDNSNFFEYFGTIEYKYLTNYYSERLVNIKTESNNNNKSYFEIPNYLQNADEIKISLNIRNKNIVIILK